jgi:hypothetical protein
MVQLLRDQMRNYEADQSGAIRAGQLAQNVQEWGTVINKVGNIAKSYAADKVAADESMINTQIGETAKTDLMDWYTKQVKAGVDPTTEDFKNKLYAERDRIYQPLIDQMGTQKGREFLQKQALDAGERLRQDGLKKIGQLRKKAQAQAAYNKANNQMKTDAQEFGKLGDWDGFQEAIEPTRKAMLKYAKAQGGEAGEAAEALKIDTRNMINFLGGMAQEDPETVLTILDDKQSLKQIVFDRLDEAYPNMSAAEKEEKFKELYEKSGQKASADEQLAAIMTEPVREAFVKHYQNSVMAEKKDLQERLKSLPKGSRAYEDVKKQIEELQGKLDDPDAGAMELLRNELNHSPIRDMARKQLELNKLQAKKMEEETFVTSHVAAVSPDAMTRFEARSNLALQPMAQKRIEGFWNSEKVTPQGFKKLYDDYLEEDKNAIENMTTTYNGTDALAAAVNKALQGGDRPDVEKVADMFSALAELHKAPGITQDDFEHVENILHAGMLDNVFGDLSSKVIDNPDRLFPDTSWVTNIMNPMKTGRNISKDTLGLPANTRDTDIDTVTAYLQDNAIRITKDSIAMLSEAAKLPDTASRQAAVQEVENYIAKEKDACYNYAMKTFGIDLAKLREQKQKSGRAFTQIGWRVKEYLGDDPDGKPLFQDATDKELYNAVVKRIQDGIEASKAAGKDTSGAEKAVKVYNKVKNKL